MDEGEFSRGVCAERKFLVSLARKKFRMSVDDAEDAVQTAILRAWASRDRYDDQQKLRAWLVVIMVNGILSRKRRAWRLIFSDDATVLETSLQPGNQFETVFLRQVLTAMLDLPLEQLDAIILISRGYQYDQAAEMTNTAAGTMKSRVARGRAALREAVE